MESEEQAWFHEILHRALKLKKSHRITVKYGFQVHILRQNILFCYLSVEAWKGNYESSKGQFVKSRKLPMGLESHQDSEF